MKKLIYIASPYSNGGELNNVARQQLAANKLIDLGYSPIWPLANHYLHIQENRSWQEWMDVVLPQVAVCDGLWRLPGESAGADQEVAFAEQLGIEVRFGPEDECPWEPYNEKDDVILEIMMEPSNRLNELDYFMLLAIMTSYRSKDPSSKCGTVIVDENRRIVSTGYNGFPAGYSKDLEEELLKDRELKYANIIHSEMNALFGAIQSGRSVEGATCYVNLMPCSNCAKHLIAAGIKKVVYMTASEDIRRRWHDEFESTMNIFHNSGIEVEEHNPSSFLKRIIAGKVIR